LRVTDAQVRKLMREYEQHGHVEKAGLKAGMSRNTAAKYLAAGQLPSDLKRPRTWRTRTNPFEEDWPYVVELLETVPELEAKTIFDLLVERSPGRYQEGQLRTLQRHVRQWRAESGPPKEVFFAQEHRPGEAMQSDFTSGNALGITIEGEPFGHLLCHPVLPYSNWEWVSVCRSESLLAIKRGVQSALVRLGCSPKFLQTDHSTAATHRLGKEEEGDRGFNQEYVEFAHHYSMTPRTIAIGQKHQNGDVEGGHNAFKNRVDQQLLLRGSRDFESVEAYESWLREVAEAANSLRRTRLSEELEVMRALPAERLREHSTLDTRVLSGSTIRIKSNTYSVPSRLRGQRVAVRVYEDRIEVFYAGKIQLRTERLLGKNHARIDYRHIVSSLVQKPGAFARYRYREELFPTLAFRRAYDRIVEDIDNERRSSLEYLRILHLAATESEVKVEEVLTDLLHSDGPLTAAAVKALVRPTPLTAPKIDVPSVDLSSYDELLKGVAS